MGQNIKKAKLQTALLLIISLLLALSSFFFTFTGRLTEADIITFVAIILTAIAYKYYNSKVSKEAKKSFIDIYRGIRKEIGTPVKVVIAFFVILFVVGYTKYCLIDGQCEIFMKGVTIANVPLIAQGINVFILFVIGVFLAIIDIDSLITIVKWPKTTQGDPKTIL